MSAEAAAAEAAGEIPPLARDRRVQAWAVSSGISMAGDAAWTLGLAWTAASVGGAHGAGLVLGVGTLPRALLTVFGGAIADRADARRTMVASNLARIVVLLAGLAVLAMSSVTISSLAPCSVSCSFSPGLMPVKRIGMSV